MTGERHRLALVSHPQARMRGSGSQFVFWRSEIGLLLKSNGFSCHEG